MSPLSQHDQLVALIVDLLEAERLGVECPRPVEILDGQVGDGVAFSKHDLLLGDNSPSNARRAAKGSRLAVPQGQIVGAAHLDQARGGAFELEGAVAGDVEALRLGVGGGEQFDLMLVERVDQGDEARRLVAVLGPELGDADEDDRVEAAGDGEIVGRAPAPRRTAA